MQSNPKFHMALIKRFAKVARRTTGLPVTAVQNQLAPALGYASFHELNERCKSTSTSSTPIPASIPPSTCDSKTPSISQIEAILPADLKRRIVFRFRVGSVTWAVEASTYGPVLLAESGPPVSLKPVGLGLYPVIVQRAAGPDAGTFSMTRYAHHAIFDLSFYTLEETFELGRLAGIPIWPQKTPWSRARRQQTESQLAFLGSPAFAAVRHWIRAGGHELVEPRDWISGLPCLIWTTLVAMSDADFAFHADAVAEAMFRKLGCSWDERDEIWETLCSQWHSLRPDGTALDVPLTRLLMRPLQHRLASTY